MYDLANSNVKGIYEDFKISILKLKIEDKMFIIYIGEVPKIRTFNGQIEVILEISIRNICLNLIYFVKKYIEENEVAIENFEGYKLRYFSKDIEELEELKDINKRLKLL